MNRLNLDFSLETNEQRAAFVNKYVEQEDFRKKPLTENEMETIANYILWGRNAESGLNAVQEKSIQIATKHGTWDANDKTESLDALIESPTFNEAQLSRTPTRYTQKAEKFSREDALARCSEEQKPAFEALFRRIDQLDLEINFYELRHEKRTKPIRDALLNRFTKDELAKAQEKISHWTPYRYLKQRHELVELRREQYTLRDSVVTPIIQHNTVPAIVEAPTLDWGADITVRPLGLWNRNTALVFREWDKLNPDGYSEKELEWISGYYWEMHDQKDTRFVFDFCDLESVYQLFLLFFEMEDAGEVESVEGNTKALMNTLRYYMEIAELSELQEEILDMKIKQVKNQDIASYVNKKYGKNYTANYISTIFRQKIIPQINNAAARHAEVVGNLFFPEEFKTCTCCGTTYLKSAEYFVRKARSKDGLSSRCKKCDKRDRDEKKVIELVRKK